MGEENKKRQGKIYAYRILAICFWLIMWEGMSIVIGSDIVLSPPGKVLRILFTLVREADFWQIIASSTLRILFGFLLALITGTVFAVLSYKSRLFSELVSPLMKVVKATPVASFIILALIWIRSKNLSVLISFLMVVPVVYMNIQQGLMNTNEKLLQFAEVFRISPLKRIKAIYFPAILPYLVSAVSIGLGFGFKSGIAAEVIGIPSKSIGEKLYEAKLYLMTGDLLAWTIVIILISVLLEKGVMKLMGGIDGNRAC